MDKPASQADCPPSLEYLGLLDGIIIKQVSAK